MTKGLRSIRPLDAASLRGIEPARPPAKRPKFEWVDPKTLYIEEAYQRNILSGGIALIRKIYAGFDWTRFKPPVCVRLEDSGNVLVCIDGQHTATAAASHPGIEQIPVMIVTASDAALRAGAFVGHNKDRIALTQQAIYHAEVAAGDKIATMIDRVMSATGARIPVKAISAKDKHPVGTTVAIGTIRAIAKRQGEAFLFRVLDLFVRAGRELIKADEIAAAAIVFQGAGLIQIDAAFREIVAARPTDEWTADARVEAVKKDISTGAALAMMWSAELNLALAIPQQRASKSNAMDLITSLAPPQKEQKQPAEAAPTPAPPVKIAPHPASKSQHVPVPTAETKVKINVPPPPPAPDPARFVERNGIKIDVKTGELTYRNRSLIIPHGDRLSLVTMLTRVAPAMLDHSRVIAKVLGVGTEDGHALLRDLIADVNPGLKRAGLEIRSVPKAGVTLADLG
jgi:hypothetical protein